MVLKNRRAALKGQVVLLLSGENVDVYVVVQPFISVNPFRITWSRHRNELIVRAWEKAGQGLGRNFT